MSAPRPSTPDRRHADGSTTITMKRACNGCGTRLGDATDEELVAGMNGRPLPDVRRECPTCGPTAPEPECRPMTVVAGDALCVEMECDHSSGGGSYGTPPDSYCDEVTEQVICSTHSTFAPGFEDVHEVVTHAEPWPCQHGPAPGGAV
ncbi:hypothetical protein ACFUIY_14650 [Streptomyces griseorubiginosus]|uniref:hypothetical protein n=1 Tax=Streptomyces griseorubiginosus TaxID=67304 RepID=UPI003633FB69